jgi:prolyl-tRNA synthetase
VSSQNERFLADFHTDFPEWYQDVVRKARLAESAPVAGCMIIKPYGYALWENMVRVLDDKFKETGHENVYFPALIPESYLRREAQHVEGFSPECAVVTHGGGKELDEPLVFRPTSETIIWQTYSDWVESYRDLPLLYNQWANVCRWEMRPRLFLRTREFLWQEGHTAHATKEEAVEETLRMLEVYRDFAENTLALPVYPGVKTESERFPGAVDTYSIEAMMRDKKALQAGTSHFLGENFAKAFNVTFQNDKGEREYVWGTSWGVSTRLVGAVVMGHGDELGLRLPPRIAPHQVVIVPIYQDASRERVLAAAKQLAAELKPVARVKLDDRDNLKPGFKFNEWELCGVPLRIELGPKDLDQNQCVLARRTGGKKRPASLDGIAALVATELDEIQKELYDDALKFREENTRPVETYDELKSWVEKGAFVNAHWCESATCELTIKNDTKATIRCVPLAREPEEGKCVLCGGSSPGRVLIAKAY